MATKRKEKSLSQSNVQTNHNRAEFWRRVSQGTFSEWAEIFFSLLCFSLSIKPAVPLDIIILLFNKSTGNKNKNLLILDQHLQTWTAVLVRKYQRGRLPHRSRGQAMFNCILWKLERTWANLSQTPAPMPSNSNQKAPSALFRSAWRTASSFYCRWSSLEKECVYNKALYLGANRNDD